jgi:hypothetical protein
VLGVGSGQAQTGVLGVVCRLEAVAHSSQSCWGLVWGSTMGTSHRAINGLPLAPVLLGVGLVEAKVPGKRVGGLAGFTEGGMVARPP